MKLTKRILALIISATIGIAMVGCSTENSDLGNKTEGTQLEDNTEQTEANETEENTDSTENTEKVEDESIPTEFKSALKKAKTYSDMMNMSKKGLFEQLTSEYGEKFTEEAAQYAIDNVDADWKENALKKAKTYQDTMSMSPSAIYDQLISEYGEQFTEEEAQYAIDNLE